MSANVLRLASLLVVLAVGCSPSRTSTPEESVTAAPIAAANSSERRLTLDEVFTEWRPQYADLIGRNRDAAIERFGDQFTEETPGLLSWPKGAGGRGRAVDVGLTETDASGIVFAVKVYAAAGDTLDPLDIVKQAPQFSFSSGTITDSTAKYFTATTKDERDSFQLVVSDSGVKFSAALFQDPEGRTDQTRAR